MSDRTIFIACETTDGNTNVELFSTVRGAYQHIHENFFRKDSHLGKLLEFHDVTTPSMEDVEKALKTSGRFALTKDLSEDDSVTLHSCRVFDESVFEIKGESLDDPELSVWAYDYLKDNTDYKLIAYKESNIK